MPITVYPDRIDFTNYSLRLDSDGVRVTPVSSSSTSGTFQAQAVNRSVFQGLNYGYISGGGTPATNTIERFSFAVDGNATDVGDLTTSPGSIGAGQSSTGAGYTSGGYSGVGPTFSNTIDSFPFASNSNARDVGDLTVARGQGSAGQSSSTHGYTSGGRANSPSPTVYYSNVIDRFPFAAIANATDVGDLVIGRDFNGAGQSSSTHGYTGVGNNPPQPVPSLLLFDKFPFATSTTSAATVGSLTINRRAATGQSSTVSGYTSGGDSPSPTLAFTRVDKFPFATDASATNVGNLTQGRYFASGQSSTVSGYTSGGRNFPSPFIDGNTIDKFPFSTDANATDVGDLTITTHTAAAGQQV